MATVTCSACTATEDNPKVEGKQPDMPTGWAQITIAERGTHVRNFLLCRLCTMDVRRTLARLNKRYRDSVTVGRHAAASSS